jgi:hypothetical protein
MQILRKHPQAEQGRLLRLLFVRNGPLPANSGGRELLSLIAIQPPGFENLGGLQHF